MIPELSICIPTYNRAALLDENLRRLVPQCEGRPVEICVSSNASTDQTAVVLAKYPSDLYSVRSITQLFNIGIDRNILAALRMATGRYVLPAGDDELIRPRGVDAILAALRNQPHMLMLNGWRQGKAHLPADLQGRSYADLTEAFERLWDKMPLGGFAIRREFAASQFADRYLGTHHAYSGAVWDYLLSESPVRIDCMSHPVIEFRQVPKAWAPDAETIRSVEIPRWFDLIPSAYGEAVQTARSKYLRTWANPSWGNPSALAVVLARASALPRIGWQDVPEIEPPRIPAAGLILFCVGVALGIPVSVVGNLLAGELVLAVVALVGTVANLGNVRFPDRTLISFVGLFLLSLCVYVTTDVLWQTEMHDAARGWARFAFLIGDFVGLWVLGRRDRFSLFPLFGGYMAGQVAAWARPQPAFALYVTLWKHHLCLPVLLGTLCAIGIFLKRGSSAWAIASLAAFGLLSFQVDTRAFGLVCFVAAAVVAARAMVFERIRALMRSCSPAVWRFRHSRQMPCSTKRETGSDRARPAPTRNGTPP